MVSAKRSTKQHATRTTGSDSPFEILFGDCVESMQAMPEASVDAVVTDPPYGINFMGKAWDSTAIREAVEREVKYADRANDSVRKKRLASRRSAETGQTVSGYSNRSSEAGAYDFSSRGMLAFQEWTRLWAVEAFRVLKPGGHVLSFSSPRTYHRMVVGIEDAGFEIRDALCWLYGSGFPKNMNVAIAIDKHLGVDSDVVAEGEGAERPGFAGDRYDGQPDRVYSGIGSLPATFDVKSPSSDERKQWDGWGTALKPGYEPVVVARKPLGMTVAECVLTYGTGALNIDGNLVGTEPDTRAAQRPPGRPAGASTSFGHSATATVPAAGRWPSNLVLSHHADCQGHGTKHAALLCHPECPVRLLEEQEGGVARFFYVAKATRRERIGGAMRNLHPTVKPMDLMRHLVRLVTPPGGLILDPFLGSGTTGCAAMAEGFRFVGCEREQEYHDIAVGRISDWAFAHNRL
jgi:DNA modification methylase